MHRTLKIVLCSTALLAVPCTYAQTAAEVFREMDTRQRAGISGIENFSQMKTTMGMCTLEHFEKETTEAVDGRGSIEYMRLVSPVEVAERNSQAMSDPLEPSMANASPEELEAIADGLRSQKSSMDALFRDEVQSANLPGGLGLMLMNPPPGKPWLSPMPGDMLENYAVMLDGAAAGKRQDTKRIADAEQEAQVDPLASISEQTRVVGRESVGGSDAIVLVAEGLNWTPEDGDGEFTLNTLRLWVDANDYVPLKMSMEGVVQIEGEAREMQIEREDSNYESVAGCGEFKLPHRTVMRIAGIMSPEEEAQMAQAQEQLEEFKQQMEAMPESQKQMIMRQMGPQMEMFEKMAAGGGIEVVSQVTGLRCNAGVPTNETYMQTIPGVSAGACIGFGADGE